MKDSEEDIILYQSRYYDEVFGTYDDFPVPTSQTRNAKAKADFKERVNKLLDGAEQKNWPHKGRVIVNVEIKGSKSYINRIDIDNVLKLLLDILKTRVFVDDKQVFSLMATKFILEKHEDAEIHGFMFGLRLFNDEEKNMCIPDLFSQNPADGKFNGPTTMWKSIEIK